MWKKVEIQSIYCGSKKISGLHNNPRLVNKIRKISWLKLSIDLAGLIIQPDNNIIKIILCTFFDTKNQSGPMESEFHKLNIY
jgi:hypothetical protein